MVLNTGNKMDELDIILELNDVSIIRNSKKIIDQISLKIFKKKTTVIVGGLGSGKSTLLKTLAGIIPTDSGKLIIEGKSFNSMSVSKLKDFRKRNGFMFQDSALWSNKNLYQNLSLPLQLHFPDMSTDEIDRIIKKTCRSLSIDINLNDRPAQISSGNRKLISLARTLITDPEIIFIDNPLSSLDFETSRIIRETIKKLKYREKTMIICTYDPEITSMLSDFMIIIKDNRVYAYGTYNDIVKSNDTVIRNILSHVIDKASNFDDDILDLISPDFN